MASSRPGGSGRRKRTKFSKNQLQVLIEAFEKDAYPDVTVREELAKQIQIPQSRIQVWFQNRRGRQSKDPRGGPTGGRRCSSRIPPRCIPCPPPPWPPGPSPQLWLQWRNSTEQCDQFSWEAERASGPAVPWGHTGMLGTNVASPDLETPAKALGEPSGNSHHSSAMSAFPAPQQPFPVEAGGIHTHLGDPRALIYGDWALQGQVQHFPSDGQQPRVGWQPLPTWEPGMAPQQPLSQHPGAQKQPLQPPSAQEHWMDPTETRCLKEEDEP